MAQTFGKLNRPVARPVASVARVVEVRVSEDRAHDLTETGATPLQRNLLAISGAIIIGFFAVMLIAGGANRQTAVTAPKASDPPKVNRGLRDVQMANLMCDSLNSRGAGTAPCEVGPLSITVYSNSTIAEAQDLCGVAVQTLRDSNYYFAARWTFHIKSPYSGGQSIAYCQLPYSPS